ncbi:endo-1,4-beta-xylanase [Jeotgalibaca caeni]|uniref:endo-1,4-beta-xylanase n=1 Tax=Jeotgalibaca caeni TaxID=3028623 RepID=UPI00237D7A58|nr:endo-1,4-beta-xylanase [Jeotgalibaca caeni]MDE1548936.1 endo-1,4-beta-xylanase [Jeotgalibaca caeni]
MTEFQTFPQLKEVFQDSFKVGAAVNEFVLRDRGTFIAEQFNSVTAENCMKFESLQPTEGVFDFAAGDQIVQFAKQNQMAVRGHTLVWHNQTPEWVFRNGEQIVSKEQLLERMQTHMETVLGHYQDDIRCWDVVNEAVDDKGNDILRKSKWLEILGDSFIETAFRMAHAANPKAELFYNDYNESSPEKSDKIYRMVRSLLERDVPIHGIGLQCHWNLTSPSMDAIKAAIEKYASLGLRLHVTEMDVSVFDHEDKRTSLLMPTEAMLQQQAERYEQFFQVFKSYQDVIDSVTFWGVDDSYTWLDDFPVRGRKNWPFVFDEKSQPKSSFWNIIGNPTR